MGDIAPGEISKYFAQRIWIAGKYRAGRRVACCYCNRVLTVCDCLYCVLLAEGYGGHSAPSSQLAGKTAPPAYDGGRVAEVKRAGDIGGSYFSHAVPDNHIRLKP
jgi:hypothetical protein